MKNSSGKAVKILAIIIGILGFIAAFGVGAMKEDGFSFARFMCAAAAALMVAVLIYGFGELIANTAQIKQTNYEVISNLRELIAKTEAKAVSPAKKEAAQKAADTEKKEQSRPLDNAIAPYEKLHSAAEIYKHFCECYKENSNEDTEACADRLKKIAEREQVENVNAKNNALSLVKSFYKHDCRIFAVDRSGATFRCPVCGNKIFSDRRSCHHCGALFRI